jgi:hypothetical protein
MKKLNFSGSQTGQRLISSGMVSLVGIKVKNQKKRLSSKDFRTMVDVLLEDAFKVKVKYSPKKSYQE